MEDGPEENRGLGFDLPFPSVVGIRCIRRRVPVSSHLCPSRLYLVSSSPSRDVSRDTVGVRRRGWVGPQYPGASDRVDGSGCPGGRDRGMGGGDGKTVRRRTSGLCVTGNVKKS